MIAIVVAMNIVMSNDMALLNTLLNIVLFSVGNLVYNTVKEGGFSYTSFCSYFIVELSDFDKFNYCW